MDDKAKTWQEILREIIERKQNEAEKGKKRSYSDFPRLELPVAEYPEILRRQPEPELETYCENAIKDILQ